MYLIFVASINENMKLAISLQKQFKELKKESLIVNLVELELPMYDSQKEEKDGIPKNLDNIIKQMQKADGYIFVSPEYNYLLPPVLINFIAWISRSTDDFRTLFALKVIQLATHSGSGGHDVLNAMRTQFTKLGSLVVPREIVTTYQTPLQLDSSMRILQQFVALSDFRIK